jgi:acid phosphatase type 7
VFASRAGRAVVRAIGAAGLLGIAGLLGSHVSLVPAQPPARDRPGPVLTGLPAHRATVWAVGDGANGTRRAIRLAGRIAAGHPDLFLYLGDVYGATGLLGRLEPDGSAADFADHYARVYGRLAPITAPTPGNHEWALRAQGYRPYWDRVMHRPVPDFYALRIAGWEVLSLNSETDHDARSRQVAWLRARMTAAAGTCRLAFWHRPRYSSGGHGDQPDVAPLWDALRGHAAIVLNGHDHDLERYRPVDGITEFVVGAGGRRRGDLRPDPRHAFADDRDYGALRLALRPGLARWALVATSGRVLDRGQVRCRPLQALRARGARPRSSGRRSRTR